MHGIIPDGSGAFTRLSPFIREYIYRNGWDGLRPIQEEACKVIFDSDDHLILSSGTASGKTEAAFLPILPLLEQDPPSTVGVLYIAPMKALINDQFYRLTDLMEQSGIPLCHWHGDVPQSKKAKFLRNPGGVLQITPESLEAMLITRVHELVRIFGDLRFVVIDEMHAFMNSERGLQVLCQLARLQRYTRLQVRRIGLSATLGDYGLPAKWLAAGTDRNISIPQTNAGPLKIRLSVEHFAAPALEGDDGVYFDPSFLYIYDRVRGKKAIIFGNGREETDASITAMRRIAAQRNEPDIFHVHHGSISATLRETAETDMKELDGPTVIGATVTMELGVDIGRLERVFQIGAPISVASFVQRMGRTGRRGEPPEMWFVDWEGFRDQNAGPLQQIPWRLIKIIAIIQLYVEERWIEPPKILRCSMSMLYHQIMSAVASIGEIALPALLDMVQALPAFTQMDGGDILRFVRELIRMGHLQEMEDGGLIIGFEGEKVVNHFEFYGVFPTEEEWIVMHESQKIGHIEDPVAAGEYITLAGHNWLVTGVDFKRLMVFVVPLPKHLRFIWHGDRALTHDRVLQRMRQVLQEPTQYPYLGPKAVERLREGRAVAHAYGFDRQNAVRLDDDTIALLPWMGHRNYRTLRSILVRYGREAFGKNLLGGVCCYYMTIKNDRHSSKAMLAAIQDIFINGNVDPYDFLNEDTIRSEKKRYEYKVPKYDRYVPNALLKTQVIQDYIDIPAIQEQVMDWE